MSPYLLAGTTKCMAEIAASTKRQLVIQALLGLEKPAITLELAKNVNLSPETRILLRKSAKVEMLAALAASAVGDLQIKEALSSKNKRIVDSLYGHGVKGASAKLSDELIEKASALQAYLWLDRGSLPSGNQLLRLLDKASFSWTFLADPRLVKVVTPTQAMRIVKKFLDSPDAANHYGRLDDCLDARPELIPAFVKIATGRQEYASLSPIFEALFNTRHIFDQNLYSKLIKASARLPKLDRHRVLADLYEHPNLGADATYEVYLAFSSDPTIKRASKDYLGESFQYHHDRQMGRLAVVTQDWATVKSGPQKKTIARYRKLWHGEYPTLDFPNEYKNSIAIGSSLVKPKKQDLTKVFLKDSDPWGDELTTLLTPDIFESQVLPSLTQLGLPGVSIFFGLAHEWNASLAELIHATRSATL